MFGAIGFLLSFAILGAGILCYVLKLKNSYMEGVDWFFGCVFGGMAGFAFALWAVVPVCLILDRGL